MTTLQPRELANLWYLKFGHSWVVRNALNSDWKEISRELMKNNLADYNMSATTEVVKLKESYK